MKKRFIFIIVMILITSILLSSCINGDNSKSNSTTFNNDKIQIWYYAYQDTQVSEDISKILEKAKVFCDENNIPLEVFKYDANILSQEDYKLKRNVSAATGNAIIIEDIDSMRDLSEQHADYSKISNYNNLINSYKNKFCIPFGTSPFVMFINNEAMQFYGINPEKKLITYTEYLKIKQDMKERGAKFELNYTEFGQLINYYLNKHGLLFMDGKNEIMGNNEILKSTLKNIIIEVYNDICLYYDVNINMLNDNTIDVSKECIYDENSDLVLQEQKKKMVKKIIHIVI